MEEKKYSYVDTKMYMELVSSKTILDGILNLLQKKHEKYLGLDHGEVEMILDMFRGEKENGNA